MPLTIKILDFGIAKILEEESSGPDITKTGMVMGSPVTIAPEQAAGKPHAIGPHTDIYSLGVILYWMLAGRPPFMDELATLLLAKHITENPPSLMKVAPGITPKVAELVARCLNKDPRDRPESAELVLQEFADALGQELCLPPDASGEVVLSPVEISQPRVPTDHTAPLFGITRDAPAGGGEGDRDQALVTGPTVENIPHEVTAPTLAKPGPAAAGSADARPGKGRRLWMVAALGVILLAAGLAVVTLLGDGGRPPVTPRGAAATTPPPAADAAPGPGREVAAIGAIDLGLDAGAPPSPDLSTAPDRGPDTGAAAAQQRVPARRPRPRVKRPPGKRPVPARPGAKKPRRRRRDLLGEGVVDF
jgi:serine/threonine-protein kinase